MIMTTVMNVMLDSMHPVSGVCAHIAEQVEVIPNKQAQASTQEEYYDTNGGSAFCVNCAAGKANTNGLHATTVTLDNLLVAGSRVKTAPLDNFLVAEYLCTDCGTSGSNPNKQAQALNSGNTYDTNGGSAFCVNC